VRQVAPPDTLGGGRVLDPQPRRHGPSREVLVRLERLARGEAPEPTGRARPAVAATARSASVPRESGPPRHIRRTPSEARPQKPLSNSALALEQRLRDGGVEPPIDSELDAGDLAALRDAGRAVRVSRALHYHAESLDEIRARLVELANRNGGAVTLAQLRDELHTSRKFAQALLEHFDSEKITIRRGDEHVLRRRS
jgi:selenocysteine-specific elongation factor